ncbi:oxygen-independent coproporphyrinogen III oxidase [Roseicyclus mahoneyensis]|uniref:Coproporphyrinogen-III oxidase n=1 Tax=Roseicyclus mahoneyensis TaxID=164332 RepID=A0A316GH93_9RHOB|nr:oxygen-independent coproporphyrinogen III oxidase [Roseicyclus mahoneyensis]PWK60216.1 oxygen-independent coproporphyrinogen-3 oxidase [Roseicyclus mahoneyensis]
MEHVNQLRRLGLFDAKVPRYTSYPPATKFSNDVDGPVFLDWLRDIPPGARISLYLHVPFCRRLCWFCACRTQGVQSDTPVQAYVDTLKQEIATMGRLLPEGVEVARLHWGGGTPTLLSAAMMTDLSAHLRAAFTFTQDVEFSVEVDPNEIDSARIDALAAAGMNRASIGVQDFDPDIQQIIGRLQSYEVTRDAVEALRRAGIHSLNADILFGLPNQSQEKITDSVQMLLSLVPDRVALYGYAHVPWMAKRQAMIPTEALPTPEARLHLFETARRLFLWDQYQEIGIDHFARPEDSMAVAARTGHLRRNFQGYTDDTCEVLIGLGASAISRFPQGYAQNASSTATYQKSVRAGELATGRGHAFKGQDRLRSRLIEMLMCEFRIDNAEIRRDFDISEIELAALERKVADQFPGVTRTGTDSFEILTEGRPLARMIARGFDEYEMRAEGHSSAI